MNMKTALVACEKHDGLDAVFAAARLMMENFGSYIEGAATVTGFTEIAAMAPAGAAPVLLEMPDDSKDVAELRGSFERNMRGAGLTEAGPSRGGASMPPLPGQSYNGGPQSVALSIIYQGEKVSISKDRFVIGRGKQSSDLTLKDPNVSRQHAMVEYQNGVYFMVDMGSTNGVEYNGQRIARKQIAEGDVFRICDHDLRFTYR